jgi:hypothetical protein
MDVPVFSQSREIENSYTGFQVIDVKNAGLTEQKKLGGSGFS